MRPLPLPTATTVDALNLCISGIDDAGLRLRLLAISQDLETGEANYHTRAQSQALHLMPRVQGIKGVTGAELKALYSDHLSASNGAARKIYNKLRAAAPHRKCPLCGVGTVAVLDHHLPKSKYPDLSISPCNLVPACHFCNDTKKARHPKSAGEQTLHPYYDAYLTGQWVWAVIDQGPPISIIFSVNSPSSWSITDRQRAARHFKICGLGITFASNANDELRSIKKRLTRLFKKGGQSAVSNHLDEMVLDHDDYVNSWQHVLYQTLSGSTWFTGGGFAHIS